MSRRIVITGAAGTVGRCVLDGLRGDPAYEVVGADVRPDAALGIVPTDVASPDDCLRLLEGADTVIHLAYKMKHPSLADSFAVNYLGTYHIYEAARERGVRRVIFGSSNHTVGRYPADERVDAASPYRPSNLYGLSKCHGELLGRLYADKHGISSFNVRIGTYFGVPPRTVRHQRTWISGRDLVHLMKCCIEADDAIKYLTLFGISDNRDKYWEIAHLRGLIGYFPQDDGGAYAVEADPERDAGELVYQGGITAYRPSVR